MTSHGGGFALLDVDLARPMPDVSVGAPHAGVAVVVRRRGRPVGFAMEPIAAGVALGRDDVARIAARAAADAALVAAIGDELPPMQEADGPPPSLTVAVCTRDRADCLPRCLDALVRHVLHAPDGTRRTGVELLVVDNAPSDERTAACVARVPEVRYVREPRPGLNFARNRAVVEAGTRYVAYVDDDAVVDAGWYEGFVESWRRDPSAGAYTGLVLPLELETEAQVLFEMRGGFRRGFAPLRYAGDSLAGNPCYPAGAGIFGAGCNMVLDRDVVVRLGGFDEALDVGTPTNGGGDLDIFYRVVRAGRTLLYEPAQLVFHQHRRDVPGLRRQYWTWGVGFMSFMDKSWRADAAARPRIARMVRWWFGDQLRQLASAVARRHPLPPRMVLAELRGGVLGLCGTYARSLRYARRQRPGER